MPGTGTALTHAVSVFRAARSHRAYLFANRRADRLKRRLALMRCLDGGVLRIDDSRFEDRTVRWRGLDRVAPGGIGSSANPAEVQ